MVATWECPSIWYEYDYPTDPPTFGLWPEQGVAVVPFDDVTFPQ